MKDGIATLLVIDGLGVGEMEDVKTKRPLDNGANTLASINTQYRSELFEKLGFNSNLTSIENTKIGKSILDYEGADSFLGHNYMIGNTTEQGISWYVEDFYNEIKNNFSNKYPVSIKNNIIFLGEDIFIANNIEADLGNVINVVGNTENINFKELKSIGDYISKSVNPMRTIVMGGYPLNKKIIEQNIKSFPLSEEKTISGIDIPSTGIYNDNYQVIHIGKDINDPKNLLLSLKKENIPISLIGKSADLFEQFGDNCIHSTDTNVVIDEITKSLKSRKYPFIFANIQEVDLAGHSEDLKKASNIMKTIDNRINEIRSFMQKNDILLITADHGNDPLISHSGHTREYVPIILEGKSIQKKVLENRDSLSDIGATIADFFNITINRGKSFL